ncbi:MAG: 30S ribosomal protein S20 [Verrucomicrobia bacterium]|jgi:small subunit ribosomal protein S20|nr:30S ribosomal protein S20 [Verrucomicrobiota bacterium]
MPNTKSAERRVRANEKKRIQNRSIKTRLRKLERTYQSALTSGNPEEAAKSLRAVHSALDKAVKTGVLARPTVNRHKSRLAARLPA